MKDTVNPVVDTLVGTSAINAMVSKSNRDKMTSEKLGRVLTALGVNPVGKDQRGFFLWSGIAVQAVIPKIRKVIEDEKISIEKLAEPKKEEVKADVAPENSNLIAEIDHRVSLILRDVIDETVEKVAQMHTGNKLIFNAIERAESKNLILSDLVRADIKKLTDHVNDSINKIVMALNIKIDIEPVKQQKEKVEKKVSIVAAIEDEITKHRPHIGIVGIIPPITTQIDKEFHDAFKISMLGPNEANKISNMRNCYRVFTVRGKVMSRHLDQIKGIGQKPYPVGDSLSKIRDALTAYFIEISDQKVAA